jgi:hypothetical protein
VTLTTRQRRIAANALSVFHTNPRSKRMVRLKATELDVYVDGKRVGWIFDNGDCWRGFLTGRRKRRYIPDVTTRSDAVRAVVVAATK